jgi:hypothetical protein
MQVWPEGPRLFCISADLKARMDLARRLATLLDR